MTWALLAAIALRAATPLGYMPASSGSGLLYELCPGQLPTGVVLRNQASGHAHHHHSADGRSTAEPDSCPIGHLLSHAAALDDPGFNLTAVLRPAELTAQLALPPRSASRHAQRSRGPPA